MASQKEKAYTLKILLEDIEPRIWRTVIVPDTLTLDRLHDIIQIVMGWENSHLHQFMVEDKVFAPVQELLENTAEEEGCIRLCEILKKKGDILHYEYDFGDSWIHAVILEKVENIPENYRLQMTCLDGKMACPPEDVGGPPGFEHFCQVMKDPHDPEYDELKEWFGGKFKPRALDLDEINLELAKYLNWSRPRLLW